MTTNHIEDQIVIISVVRDFEMYNRCFTNNSHVNVHRLHPIDNRRDNANVSVQYNRFLDTYNYANPAWFVFCHEDFEITESIIPYFELADKSSLYGPIGAWTEQRFFFYIWHLSGQIVESKKDGSSAVTVGLKVPMGTPVETFDCQCLILHSSLIHKTGLRFDPELSFDLYVEDFCIQSKEKHNIPSLIMPIACKHWSTGKVGKRYFIQERYLREKYPNCCYTGTSSYDIGTPSIGRKCNSFFKMSANNLLAMIHT